MERKKFRSKKVLLTLNFLSVIFIVNIISIGYAEEKTPAKSDGLMPFITKKYEYGIPCDEAKVYGSQAVPQLVRMLKDPQFENHWENIIFTLGCIGDPAAVAPLKDFLAQHQGKISFNTFTALQSIPTALGFISYGGDQSALDALTQLADEDYWQKSKLKVFDNIAVNDATIKKNLMRSTILALGYAQKQEADQVLKTLQQDPKISHDYKEDIEFAIDQ